jgi:ABC-type branched-subunit amino acid transport system ATPase component
MTFEISIPTFSDEKLIQVERGSSVVFVGANGTGKTRLATHIENLLNLNAHRISAHRALALNPLVAKISEKQALLGLRFGYYNDPNVGIHYRSGHRWQGKEATSLLNDFDFLVQALFAEQANKSLETHKKVRSGDHTPAEPTKFESLVEIWERLLPHRKLHISGDDIQASASGEEECYPGSEMSDGERAVFYMLGQALMAAESSLIIFDEPELHVHRSIMAKLWDEIESVRSDCALVLITHDLDFAASRVAQKYIVREYKPIPAWNIEDVPQDSGFDEELVTLILGSRKPILFVEGAESSLDIAIYRCCFPEWTVIPKGSCEDVIHSVVTMRRNERLTRITCSGIIDADDYNEEDIQYLSNLGIATLPVSEIENIILLPTVSRAIAETEAYEGGELEQRLESLAEAIFSTLQKDGAIDAVITRYCRRRIDRLLKKIDLSEASTVDTLVDKYLQETASLDISEIAESASRSIRLAINNRDLSKLLIHYDNKKELMALAATHLKRCRLSDFESWLVRVLRNNKFPSLTEAIRDKLPNIRAM